MAKPAVCLVVASEMTVTAFLLSHLRALSKKYDVSVVANTQNPDFPGQYGLDVRVIPVAIRREIRPAADLRALLALMRIFRREQFDMIHSVTPKAGLLAMLAGCMARIPVRVHIFTGQVWATRQGVSRLLLKSMDRLLAGCATHVLADSASQRAFLIAERVVPADRISVLADGSISGVDASRFRPDAVRRDELRAAFGIGADEVLFLFVGRLTHDKGVEELAAAFAELANKAPDVHLLLVGPDEQQMRGAIERRCAACAGRVHFVDYTDAPERYMAASDVFCLPSRREGFGSVVIEAAACGLPAIGSDIYGVRDAIEDGRSGLLFPCGDVAVLRDCMRQLARDDDRRSRMGEYARQRALRDFSSRRVTQAWLDYYDALMQGR